MATTAFTKPEDIANRALQHCGASRIVTLQDNDKGAAEIAQCYDGLRRAELRRNLWSFSARRTVLYPINTPIVGSHAQGADEYYSNAPNIAGASFEGETLLLVPAPWLATKQYGFGHIVAHNGALWSNSASVNVGSEPGIDGSTNWDTYFGSMTVTKWEDPEKPSSLNFSRGYFIGDLVYLGQQAFVSLENGNVQPPLIPRTWSKWHHYSANHVVVDAQGWEWKSLLNNNRGNEPGVYGFWSSVPTYVIGALVIGTDKVLYQAILSTTNVNPANGAAPTDWLALGFPGSWPLWSSNETYAKNAVAAGLDGMLYQSVQAGNTNQQPVGATYNPNTPAANWWVSLNIKVPWISNFGSSAANSAWLGLDASLDTINITYPVGTGPSIQTQNKNVFMLPNGYLRNAPQEPKAGSVSFLGAPTGRMYDDWEIDGNYLISQTPFPIIFRFGADVTQVDMMDDMFCEALGARVGLEVCETLTQSNAKINTITANYKAFIDQARTINGIEQGPTEPPEDDYITCRI